MTRWWVLLLAVPLSAQTWDIPAEIAGALSKETEGKLTIHIEQRERYESREGNGFGKDVDVATALARTRLSLTYETPWLKLSGMLQDVRAPGYGANAPSNLRDPADLQEGYLELFPKHTTGFGLSAGRRMLTYGDGRLIGTPQWGNCSRTYDHARVFFATSRARVEALLVSPVKIQQDGFNRPVLGDRIWGVYSSFPGFWRKTLLETYLLRRDQNREGGFPGGSKTADTDRLEVNTLGFRLAGPLLAGWKYTVEGAAQNGRVAAADHRATAWVSGVSRRSMPLGKQLDLLVEYKFASGSRNPADAARSRTFDQLYAANHDTFGHQDLIGWRNIHNLRSQLTYGVTKALSLNAMYSNYWLASACDSLYNGTGKAIARSTSCSAGSHVGQEADVFAIYKYKHFQLGAGYGYFFSGSFLQKTTPGANPSYVYIFHNYTL
jgi:hypothetical protein